MTLPRGAIICGRWPRTRTRTAKCRSVRAASTWMEKSTPTRARAGNSNSYGRPLHFLLEQFGPERMAWGSDWPLVLMQSDYGGGSAGGARCSGASRRRRRDTPLSGTAMQFTRCKEWYRGSLSLRTCCGEPAMWSGRHRWRADSRTRRFTRKGFAWGTPDRFVFIESSRQLMYNSDSRRAGRRHSMHIRILIEREGVDGFEPTMSLFFDLILWQSIHPKETKSECKESVVCLEFDRRTGAGPGSLRSRPCSGHRRRCADGGGRRAGRCRDQLGRVVGRRVFQRVVGRPDRHFRRTESGHQSHAHAAGLGLDVRSNRDQRAG